jgi:excisionase family DNA binding protein
LTKRTYTIGEAAELTGLSRKAIARRVERGSLQSLVRGGRRMIPRAELARAGLIPEEGEVDDGTMSPGSALAPHPSSANDHGGTGETAALAAVVRELVDRLERQAAEIAQFRALTAEAESLRLSRELGELRARLSTLESRRAAPELAQGGGEPASTESVSSRAPTAAGPTRTAGERIWLPPSAAASPAPAPADRPASRVAEPRRPGGDRRLAPRVAWLVAEILFIAAVAAGAWLANLRDAYVVAVVGAAWLLVAGLEWLRWIDRGRRA